MDKKIDSLSVTNTHDVVIENVAQDNVLQTNDIRRDIRVVGNANTLVPEKIALFDQMVVELPHREVVKWYEDNVKDMSLEEIKHMQGKVYPCIGFDAQAKLDEIKTLFGDQVKIYVKKTGWSGIKEVDINLTGCDIMTEGLNWLLSKLRGVPVGLLEFTNCQQIEEIDLSDYHSLGGVSFKKCSSLKSINVLGAADDLIRFGVNNCDSLQSIDGLGECKKLQIIHIDKAPLLQNFPDLSGLSNLVSLKLYECTLIEDLSWVSELTKLEKLTIYDIGQNFNEIPDLSNLRELRRLNIFNLYFDEIKIPGLSRLTKLEDLVVSDCGKFTNTSELSQLWSLRSLAISNLCDMQLDNLLLLNHPNLRRLEIDSFDKNINISGAINLECLSLRCSECVLDLSNMVNLKEVNLDDLDDEFGEPFYQDIIISRNCPFAQKPEAQQYPFVFDDEIDYVEGSCSDGE